uniref:Type I polyketide synthase n=1 Tax=Gambierdiscus polynesiensis TaxID=439318 RepID=A0A1S6K808_9DINO|nr:type I polyketide synthase [Gambierdiscus polynesiensis]
MSKELAQVTASRTATLLRLTSLSIRMAGAPEEEIAELMPLEGLFVEVVGLPDDGSDAALSKLNGERGRVIGWDDQQAMYAVQLFSSFRLLLAGEHLREFPVEDSEMRGGFDVAWPDSPTAQGVFASMVSQQINEKGFCVVQMFLGNHEEAQVMSKELSWGILKGDTEEEYLGEDVVDGKVAWLRYEAAGEEGTPAGLRMVSMEKEVNRDVSVDHGALDQCDRALTNLAALLWPLTPEWEEGFHSWGRTGGLVRAGFQKDDPEGVRGNILKSDDGKDLDRHMTFVSTKRLCMIYLIDSRGGELRLTPNNEAYEYNEAIIPLSSNKVIVFRCDDMGHNFSYKPRGNNLNLTCWVLDIPPDEIDWEEALRVLDGPEEPLGPRTNVMSADVRFPGCSFGRMPLWNMMYAGADSQVRIPLLRWDADVYYAKEFVPGCSMTCHGGLVQETEIMGLDNVFFGISDKEARFMDPCQRCVLEVGYEALSSAGHRPQRLQGFRCGVFVGDAGSDWYDVCKDAHTWADDDRSIKDSSKWEVCTRLSCVWGLVGPTTTCDTACSSSLVACGFAQMKLRRRMGDQRKTSAGTELSNALVVGTNLLLDVSKYIHLSGPQMLSQDGRCFTFDQSADGYARGEGIGAITLKVCENSVDSLNRMAVLVGTAVNQDGKTSSLTAPNGPSQQEVIKESMREGGLTPNMTTVAELHGTGTALGDPIEVGALEAVMKIDRGSRPILKTTAKTNIGHLEASAGIAGLIKCMLMLSFSCGLANVHLHVLNPHLETDGYPVYFETENTDYWSNSGLTGVSSFGFGGTNARADVWGHCQHGHRYCITGILPRACSLLV